MAIANALSGWNAQQMAQPFWLRRILAHHRHGTDLGGIGNMPGSTPLLQGQSGAVVGGKVRFKFA
jgi:hypothetical protein